MRCLKVDKYNLTQDIINQLSSKVSKDYTKDIKSPYRNIKVLNNGVNDYSNANNTHGSHKYESYSYNEKHILVVFTGTDVDIRKAIDELVKTKGYGFTFDIAFSGTGEALLDIDYIKTKLNPKNIYTEEDILQTEQVIENVDGVVVPMTTQNTVVKLSLGLQDSFISHALWQSLWHDKPVLMDFDNAITYRGNTSKRPMLQTMIEDYIQKVQVMGVKAVKRRDYLTEMLNVFQPNDGKKTDNTENIIIEEDTNNNVDNKRTIVTEGDLGKLISRSSNKKEVYVSKSSIITPLAYDVANEMGVKIIKK